MRNYTKEHQPENARRANQIFDEISFGLNELKEMAYRGCPEADLALGALTVEFVERVRDYLERNKPKPDSWILKTRTKEGRLLEVAKLIIGLFTGNPDPDMMRRRRYSYMLTGPPLPSELEIRELGEFKRGRNDTHWISKWDPALRRYLKTNLDSFVSWQHPDVISITRAYKTPGRKRTQVINHILLKCRGLAPK